MKRILFVCLGNICRSPMAEYYFNDRVAKLGYGGEYFAESAATSDEERGNPIHHGTRKILDRLHIPCDTKTARKITKNDYSDFDLIIGMDKANIHSMQMFFGGDPQGKIKLFWEFCGKNRDIADPWFTGDFETTFEDIKICTAALIDYLRGNRQ